MIAIHDAVLPDPDAYRCAALTYAFRTIDVGHAQFHGIAPCLDPTLAIWFEQHYPALHVTLSLFRQSPAGQAEPNDIHTDADMGDTTAILYLTPDPPPEDGTVFWRHVETGAMAGPVGATGQRGDAWVPWRTVPAAFNRVVVFPAPLFHSRAIVENYGTGTDARLIQVLFAKERG